MAKHFWPALLALAIAAAFFPIFLGEFPAIGDMRDVYIPLETFFHNETLAGRLPSWNPDIAWGYPVIASAQIGYFYPPLLILRLLPLWLYFPIILLGHFIFLGLGTFKFIRKLNVSPAGAYLGAISFTLGSFIVQHTTHLNIIITAAWLPWQMLVAHRLANRQSAKLKDYALFALVLGLPFLAGQIQIPFMIAAVSSIYFIYLHWVKNRQFLKPTFKILLIALAVIFIAAAQLLPTAELVMNSSRGPAGDFDTERANQFSYPLYHLPTLLFPRFFDTDDMYWGKRLEIEHGFFIGTIPLILAIYSLTSYFRRRVPRVDRLGGPPTSARSEARTSGGGKGDTGPVGRGFFVVLIFCTFLLALGSLSPFRLIGIEPSLWVFTAPSRWLLFTTFGLAIFAAFGFDQLRAKAASVPKLIKVSLPIVIAIILLANVALFIDQTTLADWALQRVSSISPDVLSGRPLSYYQSKMFSLITSARQSSLSLQSPYTWLSLASLISLPLLIKRRAYSWLLIIASVELVIVASTATPTLPWSNVLDPPTSLSQLPDSVISGQARLYSIRSSTADTGAYLTNPATRADQTIRQQQQQLLVPLIHSQFNLPGIEWPASLSLAGHTQALADLRIDEGYDIKDVKLAEALNIGAVLTPNEDDAGVNIVALNPAPRSNAAYQQINPTHIQLTPFSPDQTNISVTNSYYPGWRAATNNQSLAISKSQDIFQQISIPEGAKAITLKYQPLSIYLGLILSALALLTCGILILSKRTT